jgi:hypothetical protein
VRAARRTSKVVAALVLAATLGACERGRGDDVAADADGAATSAEAAAELTPEELGALGGQLDREPARAEEILEAEGLTWDGYQQAVREVAADADEARRYSEAFVATGGEEPKGAS